MSQCHHLWRAGCWLLATGLYALVPTPADSQQPEEIVFFDDYNKALREAKLTQKPIFLEFRCAP